MVINVVSFLIFFPLFTSGSSPNEAEFRDAGLRLAFALTIIEVTTVIFVLVLLKMRSMSIRPTFFGAGPINIPPWQVIVLVLIGTLVSGWLFVRAQRQAGVALDFCDMTQIEKLVWYLCIPIVAAFCEETIWRGYLQNCSTTKRIVYNSVSFALFHGIFNPIGVVAAFIQGIIWAWLKNTSNSTIPGMGLHLVSRYFALLV